MLNPMHDARYTATAYHEAGHAIVGLMLGHELIEVCVRDQNTGHCITTPTHLDISSQNLRARSTKRVPAEQIKIWLNRYLISDAGEAAEIALAPLSGTNPAHYTSVDEANKEACLRKRQDHWRIRRFYKKHFYPSKIEISNECGNIVQRKYVSESIVTLAEALLRKPKLSGNEVIDILMANRFHASKQLDLFWEEIDESLLG